MCLGAIESAAVQPQRRSVTVTADDLHVDRRAATAERLDRGLLGGEAGRKMAAGSGARLGGGDLPGPEEPLGQAGTAPQRRLHPVDLDQVDAEPRNGGGGRHGVITAALASADESASLTPSTTLTVARSPSILLPLMR